MAKRELTVANLLNGDHLRKANLKLGEAAKDIAKRPGKGKRVVVISMTLVERDDLIDFDVKVDLTLPKKIDPDMYHTQLKIEQGSDGQMFFSIAEAPPEDRPKLSSAK